MSVLNSVKTIGVVTATRAEYGLFLPLLKLLKSSSDFSLQLYVTGTHLSHEFGYTKSEILKDGFEITEEIDCIVSNDTPPAIGKTSGLALMGLTEAYFRNQPDLIILLGDRYETLCAAIAANLCRIPIAHLHGGEITEGAYDDGFRHAITKLSHIHFTSTKEHRNRVVQLGECPEHVFNVGAIGIDNIKSIEPMTKKDLENNLGIRFSKHNILVTLHPETLDVGSATKHVGILIEALKDLTDCTVIITGANADSEGRIINEKLKDYADSSNNCIFEPSLGQLRYISTLHIVDLVVGNSSSGIIEVPSFGIPVINIGNRQKGRLRADTVVDVEWDRNHITEAIAKNLKEGKKSNLPNPYGDGTTCLKIHGILISNFDSLDLKKKFNDLNLS